ncbi:MAG: DUF3160 domain-containing protein [Deltaproteobacteria bacterium]|nr:DUF3160 domain-containing protein [Deltaproteobacteria bacterium]
MRLSRRMRMNRWSRSSLLGCVVLVACGSRPPPLVEPVVATPAATPAPTPAAPPTTATPLTGPTCPARPGVPLEEVFGDDDRGIHFGSHRRASRPEVCAVADNNLTRARGAIEALPPPAAGPRRAAWDRRTAPARLDRIEQRFGLTADERARLYRDGFVVPARLEQQDYANAYHEIYQSQLPIYVTVDSILNAVYATHDGLVADLERTELAPLVTALVQSLHCALPAAAARFPRETALDLDLYLTVARRLLEGTEVASALGDAGVDKLAASLVAKARAATELQVVEVFGRPREIDFTQFQPRGHYTRELAPYFRGAMWLSRTEWNLVSRSSRSSHPSSGARDPRETPREVLDAFALAELVEAAQQADRLKTFERAYALLAGRREDVSVPELRALARGAFVHDLTRDDAAAKLIAAIGDGFQRTARIHPMPQGATKLPAIATLLGPRIVPDTAAVRPIAHSEVPNRQRVRGPDLAYILGQDRALAFLGADLAAFPALRRQLDVARKTLADAPRTDDLYTSWLDAIRALAAPPRGQVPSFMETAAYGDLRLDTTIAAYAQLRHNHVLIAGQPYGEGGCEIPDGFVEPAVDVYEALARYADRGAAALTPFTHKRRDREPAQDYFLRLGRLMRVFATLSRYELANQPLPKEALQFLSMVTEILPWGSDGRPTYTGWYFDLFDRRGDAIANPDLIADFFTSPVAGVSYVGVGLPRLGIFVVDTGGGPRAVVGPVAHAYEHLGPLAKRLDDAAARALPASARSAPWTASYEVPAPPEPSFRVDTEYGDDNRRILTFTAKRHLGPVVVELLDHHRVPLARATVTVAAGTTRLVMTPPVPKEDASFEEQERLAVHLMHFQVGAWHGWGTGFGELKPTPEEMRGGG